MENRILITAANGNVSSKVVRNLIAKGVSIKAAVHSLERASGVSNPLVRVIAFDFGKPETFGPILKDVERVFLLNPVPNPIHVRIFVQEAKAAGVKHIVKLSASKADVVASKGAISGHFVEESMIKDSGITYTFLQCNNFMDNYLRFAPSIRNGKIALPNGEGKVSFIDTDDIAEVGVIVLTEPGHENKIYTLTGPESLSNLEVAQILSQQLNLNVEYIDIPVEAFTQQMQKQGMTMEAIQGLAMLQNLIRENFFAAVSPDAFSILKRTPGSFREFVRKNKEKFLNTGRSYRPTSN